MLRLQQIRLWDLSVRGRENENLDFSACKKFHLQKKKSELIQWLEIHLFQNHTKSNKQKQQVTSVQTKEAPE